MDESSAALLEKARAGDSAALEQLLERHRDQVYRFGMRMCRNPDDASDVVQETLLAMARGVRDFRGASSLSTWLYTVARSFCIKHRRKFPGAAGKGCTDGAIAEDTSADCASSAEHVQSPEDALADKQVENVLNRAISELEPAYREVLVLRDAEGLTAPEVAEVLGISVQAVKSRLHRARLAVRGKVAPFLAESKLEDSNLAQSTIAQSTVAQSTVAQSTLAQSTVAQSTVAQSTVAQSTVAQSSQTTEGCPDILTIFSEHLEGDISAQVCQTMERHLQTCARCTDKCQSLRATLALCRADASGDIVPDSVQGAVRQAVKDYLSR